LQIYKAESYDDAVKAEIERSKKKKKPKKEKEASDKEKADKEAKLAAERHLREILSMGVELSDGPIFKRQQPAPLAAQSQKNDVHTASTAFGFAGAALPASSTGSTLPASTPVAPLAQMQPAQGDTRTQGAAAGYASGIMTGPQDGKQAGNAVARVDPGPTTQGLPEEFLEKYNSVHRALYGKPGTAGMQMHAAKASVDEMCEIIGIPGSDAGTFEAVNVALHRAAAAVGC
jgi:hypothetical protein